MSISTKDIKDVFLSKGIYYLYHANSALTARTYLEHGGLLSRGAVETEGLVQTSQQSDFHDKEMGVYFDIFLDTDDYHTRTSGVNIYGPITFVYKLDLLDSLTNKTLKVTKDNPIRWNISTPVEERYFMDKNELDFRLHLGDIEKHLTILDMHEPLAFAPHLDSLVIENPQISNTKYFDSACQLFDFLLQKYAPWAKFKIRTCEEGCKCVEKYNRSKEGFTYHRFRTE